MSQLADPPVASTQTLLRQRGRRLDADRIMRFTALGGAISVLLMLGSLLVVLGWSSIPSIKAYGLHFLSSTEWRPNELEQPLRDAQGKIVMEDGEMVTKTIPPEFGALPMIYGTAVSSALALIVAVPLSLGAALFLVRVAPLWLREPVSFLIEFLAAIPSIAYGIWGLFVLAPFLQGGQKVPAMLAWMNAVPPLNWMFDLGGSDHTTVVFRGIEPLLKLTLGALPGFGWMFVNSNGREYALVGKDMFCGGLILGIMVIPIITAISRDVLKAVPRIQIEGSIALGATWWQSCWEMIRYSRSGLFGGVMLGLARAAGETMAVTMVIGNANEIVASPFAAAQTMSSLLANQFAEASGELHRSALVQVALILLVMSLLFNIVARRLVVGKNARTAAAH